MLLDWQTPPTHIRIEKRSRVIPILEFICKACKNDFEEIVSRSDEKVPCPKCKSAKVERKISTFAFKSSGKFVSAGGSSCSSCSTSSGGCKGCSH